MGRSLYPHMGAARGLPRAAKGHTRGLEDRPTTETTEVREWRRLDAVIAQADALHAVGRPVAEWVPPSALSMDELDALYRWGPRGIGRVMPPLDQLTSRARR